MTGVQTCALPIFKDTYLGETSKIFVKSDKKPVSDVLEFEKTDENRYIAYYDSEQTGYEEFFHAIMAVNYPKEYEDIGFNNDLRDIVAITGGKMFDFSENDELIDFIKEKSIRKKTAHKYIRWPFIIIALTILILEIFLRKIFESRRREK